LQLALRVDSKETAVPKLYPETLQPKDYRPDPDPARRDTKTHDSERGAQSPPSGPPSHGRSSRNGTHRRGRCPARGLRVKYQGTPQPCRLGPATTTRLGPATIILAPSLMPQLHDAKEQETGGMTEDAPANHGDRSRTKDIPARKLPLSVPRTTTPTRRPRLIDSDRRLPPDQSSRACFQSTPTGTTHCKELRLGRVQDPGGAYSTHGSCSSRTPRHPPGFDTDPDDHHSVGKSPLTDSD
jgi:hypothetical protein